MSDKIRQRFAKKTFGSISLSYVMTVIVTLIVICVSVITLYVFIRIYEGSIKQNAITSSEQAVVQAKNAVLNYTNDMIKIMELIKQNINEEEQKKNEFFQNLIKVRSDIVAITIYDNFGSLKSCWVGGYELKNNVLKDLSYLPITNKDEKIHISKPHVETMIVNKYPWVVTITQNMIDVEGKRIQISMDIRFSNIASYVDDVGIGQHGYCFLINEEGDMIYHPQQQLLYSGLKQEQTESLSALSDGTYFKFNAIYTLKTLENSDWRVVGVSFVDEMITNKVISAVKIVIVLSVIVIITAFIAGAVFSKLFSKPAKRLTKAMRDFEKDTKNYDFKKIIGTSEIAELSDSFDHMVVRIQSLMERVRQEEVTLRKTQLNALQAQINPHFLYNTLDSIAWMCEEERTTEAVDMINALAKLFRISISKGHELITIEKELQHAKSYLQIQKYRYKDQFTYQLDIEETCLHYLCNKIILQPFIENAIVHGLDMTDEGEIIISVREHENDIYLSVKDNGIGMNKEQCSKTIQREAKDKVGIGINNVNNRIQIYFGEQYGIRILSELDQGTEIIVRIPKVLEGTYEK